MPMINVRFFAVDAKTGKSNKSETKLSIVEFQPESIVAEIYNLTTGKDSAAYGRTIETFDHGTNGFGFDVKSRSGKVEFHGGFTFETIAEKPSMYKTVEIAKRAYTDAESKGITFKRFETFAEMTEFAVAICKVALERDNDKLWAIPGIYSDDTNLSHRASVTLITKRGHYIDLRWNSFSQEKDISFMGKRSRLEAYEQAERFVDQIKAACAK